MTHPGSSLPSLQFLKLGGSLITDKKLPRTARLDTITRLTAEIKRYKKETPNSKLIIGHGSGSFGHIPAKKYGTKEGVTSEEEWQGFAEVWWEATSLNHILMEHLQREGLPAVSFPASGSATTQNGRLLAWDLNPINAALEANLLPVVYGDVVFDTHLGGTILSTEDIFSHLAEAFQPQRILLAGIEAGVWADYPACTELVQEITLKNWSSYAAALFGSEATDVTGGMASKVQAMLELISLVPELEVQIFSGKLAGSLMDVLHGKIIGTRLTAH
jgi:isopentenyl phosphate kinase